jgi:hypothetical protein
MGGNRDRRDRCQKTNCHGAAQRQAALVFQPFDLHLLGARHGAEFGRQFVQRFQVLEHVADALRIGRIQIVELGLAGADQQVNLR